MLSLQRIVEQGVGWRVGEGGAWRGNDSLKVRRLVDDGSCSLTIRTHVSRPPLYHASSPRFFELFFFL